jgi:hypothetical protein
MKALGRHRVRLVLILLLGLVSLAVTLRSAPASVRLKTIVDEAGVKATPEIGSKSLVKLPLGMILEAQEKRGEWYKVAVTIEGSQVSGFIHEMLVEVVGSGGTLAGDETGSAQPYLTAQIDLKISEAKELIRQGQDLTGAGQDGLPHRPFNRQPGPGARCGKGQ